MRRAGNILIWMAAVAVCGLMTYLTLNSGYMTIAYNVGVLALMVVIILFAWIFGFHRMSKTVRGLDLAAEKLVSAYREPSELGKLTRADAEIFEVEYLDRKYQEYLGFLRKTNSPCDISDYIGEYEINNYTHRRTIEMVPDILTSLGILGTFVGLVWGLRGFNPVSYEAMASSITSLVEGIKVAFVTSIYGIALSVAFSYSLRKALSHVSESLDNFTDKYYVCAVPPTDSSSINRVLANQKENTRAVQELSTQMASEVSKAMTEQLTPVLDEMNRTLDHFTQVVTMNQEEMLENVAASVMAAMKKEFIAEFLEMRSLLKETNKAQEEFLEYTEKAQTQLQENLRISTREIGRASADSASAQKEAMAQIRVQQDHLTEFVEYMTQVMQSMTRMQESNERAIASMESQAKAMEETARQASESARAANRSVAEASQAARDASVPVVNNRIEDIEELTERMDQMILLLEKQQKAQQKPRRSLFGG